MLTGRARHRLLLGVGLAASGLFLWLALRGTDLGAIGAALRSADPAPAPLFLLCLFLYYWLKTLRWQYLLRPVCAARAGRLFPAVMIGYAGSAVLPMHLGEFLRTYVVVRRLRIRATSTLASIALERMFDLMTVPILLGIALIVLPDVPPTLAHAGYVIGLGGVALFGATSLYIWRSRQFIAFCARMIGFLPDRAQRILLEQLALGAHGISALREPRLLAAIVATSLVQWTFMWGCTYLSLVALDIDLSWSAAIVVLAFTVIGVTLPTSPGFIGNIQLAYTLALQPFGVAAERAFAASVYFHLLAYLSVVIVGLYFAQREALTLAEIRHAGTTDAKGEPASAPAPDTRGAPRHDDRRA